MRKSGDLILDWFSTRNLKRLWHGIRKGEAMLCHASDPNASEYGGKNTTPGHERACVGCLALAERHLRVLENVTIKEYNGRISSGIRFTKHGFARWVDRIMFSFSKERLPAPDQSLDFGVPWECEITNNPPKKR